VIALAILAAYSVIGIWTARRNYGRLPAREIAKLGLPAYTADEEAAGRVLLWALLLGVIWPTTLVLQIISAKPPVTPQELKAKDEARDAYVKELERKLNDALESK
jgi:hypothetical protein